MTLKYEEILNNDIKQLYLSRIDCIISDYQSFQEK